MLNIGPQELILVLIIALVVVGPHRLPELGRTIGKAMREFRKIQDDVKDTIRFDMNPTPESPVSPKVPPAESTSDGEGEPQATTGTAPAADPDSTATEGDAEPRAAG